jgi:hypothetical protein
MPLEQLLEWVRRRPFVPFRVYVSDGSSYEVRHPELLMPGARAVVIGIPGPTAPEGVFERTAMVALLHITRIEPLGAAVAP